MTAVLGPGRPFTGNERELLESTLELHRAELVAAVDGLSEAQARQQLVPSLTTPMSLIKHCAAAERIWFQRTLAAMAAEDCDGHSTGGDSSFYVTADETLAGVIAEYVAACKKSRGNRRGPQPGRHRRTPSGRHGEPAVHLSVHDRRYCPARRAGRHPGRTNPGEPPQSLTFRAPGLGSATEPKR